MKDIFLSIVVPIYNAEKYLDRLINSVLDQNLDSFELILINDGSKDNSLDVMKKYSKNKNIKIIDKPNSGVSSTRNLGIKTAGGRYITFIDSDDYYRENSLNKVVNKIKSESELIVFSAKYINEKNEKSDLFLQKNTFKKIDNNYGIDGYIFGDNESIYGNCVWNKIYNLEIIKKNNISFYENQTIDEDLLFNIEYFQCISYIQTVSISVYNYCYNSNSITRSYNNKYLDEYLKTAGNLEKILINYKYNNSNSNIIIKFFVNTFIYIIDNETLSKSVNNSIKRLKKYFECTFIKENIKDVDYKLFNKSEQKKYWIIRLRLYNLFFFYLKVRRCIYGKK